MSWEDTRSDYAGGLNSRRRVPAPHQRTTYDYEGEHEPSVSSKSYQEMLHYIEWMQWDKRLRETSYDFYSSRPDLVAASPSSSPQSSPKDKDSSPRHKDPDLHRERQQHGHHKNHKDGNHKHHHHRHHHQHQHHHHRHSDRYKNGDHHHGHRGHSHGHHNHHVPQKAATEIPSRSPDRHSRSYTYSWWSDKEEESPAALESYVHDDAEREESSRPSIPKPSWNSLYQGRAQSEIYYRRHRHDEPVPEENRWSPKRLMCGFQDDDATEPTNVSLSTKPFPHKHEERSRSISPSAGIRLARSNSLPGSSSPERHGSPYVSLDSRKHHQLDEPHDKKFHDTTSPSSPYGHDFLDFSGRSRPSSNTRTLLDGEYSTTPSEPPRRHSWSQGTLSSLLLGADASQRENTASLHPRKSRPSHRREWYERPDSKKGKEVSSKPRPMEMVFFETIAEDIEV